MARTKSRKGTNGGEGTGWRVKEGVAKLPGLRNDVKEYKKELRRVITLARRRFLENEIRKTQAEIDRGGCPLREVSKAMKLREEGAAEGNGKVQNIWMNPEQCVNYIESRPTCKNASCPAARFLHYHSHDVDSDCTGKSA